MLSGSELRRIVYIDVNTDILVAVGLEANRLNNLSNIRIGSPI